MENSRCNNTLKTWNASTNCSVEIANNNRDRLRHTMSSCGQCDVTCLYSAVELCLVIGLFANAMVIILITKNKGLRHPAFIGMATLAFADFLFLLVNLTVSFEKVLTSYLCIPPLIVSRPFYIINSVFWFASNSHVALLSIIRYVTLANPLRACAVLRPTRVLLLSLGTWVLGLALLGTLSVLITLGYVTPGVSKEFIIIWWILVYLLPLVVTVILHIMKLCLVKNATIPSNTSKKTHRKLVQRMSTIVVIVIAMATVLPLPKLIFNCMRVAGLFPSIQFMLHLKGVSRLLYLLNNCLNPFVYGCFSNKIRKSLKKMCICRDVISDDAVTETNESSMSSRRSSVSMETEQSHSGQKPTCDVITGTNNNKYCPSINSITTIC